MFSILKKPQNSINADDLELLQNEIERHLVNNLKQRWKLERLLDSSSNISPDTISQPFLTTTSNDAATTTKATYSSSQPTSLPSGKLRNSMKLSSIESQIDDASDGFKGSVYTTINHHTNGGTVSGPNSNETDSISSESSLTSILTASTIITANPADSHQSTSNKRSLKNATNDRPSKRFRQNSSNSLPLTSSYPKRPPHSKHRSKIVPSKFRNSTEESRPNKKQIFKNEAPDKLWPFVEQFCTTPTEEQMKELEEMLKSIDNDKEYYKLPVSVKKEIDTPVRDEASNNSQTSNSKGRKSKVKTEEEAGLGALTQRLVSSFIEEVEDSNVDVSKSSSDASSPMAKKKKTTKGNRGIDAGSAKNLEKRIRQQLEECSILTQQDEIPFTSEEDDVLRELLAHQHELLSIQTQNKHMMQLLLKKAKRHAELEAERAKLLEANTDVFVAYHRLIQAKQRKRNPTKKERDAAYKALKVHDTIFKKCDELYMTSLDRQNKV